ncbi:MAG TPA: MerR family transcriptional regulator [Planosporangium sp.]|nr:MerR family transcriptional regulator [Planosporangium sp.]
MWTLDELLDRVRAALAGAEYPGAPNGRVRDVPDRRAVRWYATTGLVDRPAAMRGRNALYGPRHLLQLVAVKRRQAEGQSLARIQAELAGATDATLAVIAGVPGHLLAAGDAQAEPAPPRARFWAAAPAPAAAAPIPAAAAAAPVTGAAPLPVAAVDGATANDAATDDAAAPGVAATLAGVPLPGGAVLLLPVHPGPDDLAVISAAAQPLLDLLAARGLLTNP